MTITELKRYIIENNLVPVVLEKLGCHHIKHNNYYVSAANPDGDNPSAVNCYIDSDYLLVIDYTRKIKSHSDIIDFVQFIKNVSFPDAVKWLHDAVGVKFSYFHKQKKIEIIDPFARLRVLRMPKYNVAQVKPMDESVLGEFTNIEWCGLFKEGILPKTCHEFGVMYSYKWKRIIYPHRYALDGSLLAYNARTTVDNYEEFGIQKFYLTPGYKKSDNVYGLWENKQAIENAGCCIVVESEKSVLKRHSRGDRRFVAISGHLLSEEQRRLLISLNIPEIIISFDNDIKESEVWLACEKLYMFKKVSYTKDMWGYMGDKDSIADLSDDKCRFLIENRVPYTKEMHNKFILTTKEMKV